MHMNITHVCYFGAIRCPYRPSAARQSSSHRMETSGSPRSMKKLALSLVSLGMVVVLGVATVVPASANSADASALRTAVAQVPAPLRSTVQAESSRSEPEPVPNRRPCTRCIATDRSGSRSAAERGDHARALLARHDDHLPCRLGAIQLQFAWSRGIRYVGNTACGLAFETRTRPQRCSACPGRQRGAFDEALRSSSNCQEPGPVGNPAVMLRAHRRGATCAT